MRNFKFSIICAFVFSLVVFGNTSDTTFPALKILNADSTETSDNDRTDHHNSNGSMPTDSEPIGMHLSSGNDIFTFGIPDQLPDIDIGPDSKTVNVKIPADANLNGLIPNASISASASVPPVTGNSQDFSQAFAHGVAIEDTTAPVIVATEPADDEVGVDIGKRVLTITFQENIRPVQGSIELAFIRNLTTEQSYGFHNQAENITITGNKVFIEIPKPSNTIDLFNIVPGQEYQLTMSEGFLEDLSGNQFGGIAAGEWTFTYEFDSWIRVRGFTLINADTDEPIKDLVEGAIVNINDLPTLHLDIRANTNPDVESVRLSMSGALMTERTESLMPFALFRDLPIGDYLGEDFVVGEYTVTAMPYAEDGLEGARGEPFSMSFKLTEAPTNLKITGFTLVNADTDQDLFELTDGLQIDSRNLPTLNLDIRANAADDVESVRLSIASAGGGFSNTRTESLTPFAFFQDLPIGDYTGATFPSNDFFTISATPYGQDNLGGVAGSTFSLTFEIADYCQQPTDRSYVDTFAADCNGQNGRAVLETSLKINKNDAPFWDYDPGKRSYSRTVEAGIHTVTVGEYPGCTVELEYTIASDPVACPNIPLITGFTLVDADTDQDLFDLIDGMQIDIHTLPTLHLDIRANTGNSTESVLLALQGALTNERTESLPPYALFQDLPVGNYVGADFTLGRYEVSGTPYSEDALGGAIGNPFWINFELVDGDPNCFGFTAGYSKINPSTCGGFDSEITILPSGGTPPYEVGWNSFSFVGETVTGLTAGSYSATVTDANGCRHTIRVELEDPELPVVTLGSLGEVFDTDTPFALSGGMPIGGSYSGTGVATDMFDPSIGPGDYVITYTYTNPVTDCENSAEQTITVKSSTVQSVKSLTLINADTDTNIYDLQEGQRINSPYRIVDATMAKKMKIAPNQAVTLAKVGFNEPVEVKQILIFDMFGRLIDSYNPQYIRSGEDYVLDVIHYEQGNYIVKVIDRKGKSFSSQMIVKRY